MQEGHEIRQLAVAERRLGARERMLRPDEHRQVHEQLGVVGVDHVRVGGGGGVGEVGQCDAAVGADGDRSGAQVEVGEAGSMQCADGLPGRGGEVEAE